MKNNHHPTDALRLVMCYIELDKRLRKAHKDDLAKADKLLAEFIDRNAGRFFEAVIAGYLDIKTCIAHTIVEADDGTIYETQPYWYLCYQGEKHDLADENNQPFFEFPIPTEKFYEDLERQGWSHPIDPARLTRDGQLAFERMMKPFSMIDIVPRQ